MGEDEVFSRERTFIRSKRIMKVLHVCKVYLPVRGGVQTVVEWLHRGLASYDVNSTIYTTYSKGDKKLDIATHNIKRYQSWFDVLNMPISSSLVFALRRDAKLYDVVCLHYPFPLADLAITLTSMHKAKLIVYWHSEIVSQVKTSIFTKIFTKIVLKRASKIICSSPKLIEHSSILPKFQDKCVVIPFGMPKPSSQELINLCRPSESTNLVFVGRHVTYKGIDVLIDAFKLACDHKKLHVYTLILIGGGPLLDRHRQQIERLGLSKRVQIHQNASDNELAQILAKARCLVLPSRLPSEAFALVQLEAMSLAKPIINTALKSGVPWVARDGVEAITVPPEDASALSSAITKICTDASYADKLGDSAKLRYENLFSYDKFCSATYDLYRNVCSESK